MVACRLLSYVALVASSASIAVNARVVQRSSDRDCLASDVEYKHVALFSIDGFHSSDVAKYLSLRPQSTLAQLLETGYHYADAWTSAPSDSFPGTMAQVTGSSPRTHGIWYDVSWDRSFYAPNSNCSGSPGAEVASDESNDYDSTKLFSGGIDPANLSMRKLANGTCVPIYPHDRLRVNTIFEVVNSKGGVTAYTDKHPAYDIVRGPSGTGLTEGYFPEIAAVPVTVNATIAYDAYHVQAFLNWTEGVSVNSGEKLPAVPMLFGGNFQAVSVAQKTKGYQKIAGLPFTADLLRAIDFVDASLGQVVASLKSQGLYDETLIVVASKHGQAPINPALFQEVNPDLLQNLTGVVVDYLVADDIGMLYLHNHSDTQKAVENLYRNKEQLKIETIISGEDLIAQGFGDPTKDSAVPDIIVKPQMGVIYTTSNAKIAEHGGISVDDRKVACIISNPKLKKTVFQNRVETKQIAPTILKAFGFDPKELAGVVEEDTEVLYGF
ncbi:hypothetical protein RUND412_007002 [Rhizina undulata]